MCETSHSQCVGNLVRPNAQAIFLALVLLFGGISTLSYGFLHLAGHVITKDGAVRRQIPSHVAELLRAILMGRQTLTMFAADAGMGLHHSGSHHGHPRQVARGLHNCYEVWGIHILSHGPS